MFVFMHLGSCVSLVLAPEKDKGEEECAREWSGFREHDVAPYALALNKNVFEEVDKARILRLGGGESQARSRPH